MSPAHRLATGDESGDTVPIVHLGQIGLGITVDVPRGCPLDGAVTTSGEIGIGLGSATTGVHLTFAPAALQQFISLASHLLGPRDGSLSPSTRQDLR